MRQPFLRLALYFSTFAFLLLPSLSIAQEPPTIKIGVIAPLSGHLSAIGTTVKNSVILASQQLDPEKRVEFIFEDDNFLPKNSVTAAQRLISQENVSGIIIFGSGTSLAVAPISESKKVPTISISLNDSVTLNRQHMFRLFIAVDSLAKIAVEEMTKRQYKSIATITTQQDGMIALREAISKHSKIASVADEEVAPGDTDLRVVATKIARLKPSAVFLALLPPQLAAASQQLRQVGYTGEFFSGPQAQIQTEVAASNGALVGTWFTSQDDRKAASFYSDYSKQFNDVAMPDGAFGYDAARLFINAAKGTDVLGYINSLQTFEGLHGTFERVEPNIFLAPVAVKTILKDGFDFAEN